MAKKFPFSSFKLILHAKSFPFSQPHFCTNATLGKQAGILFRRHLWRTGNLREELKECLHPCELMDYRYDITQATMSVSKINGLFSSKIYISLKPYVMETEAQYTYSFLSMVAELGGYVGLFLGMSFIQLEDLVMWGLKKI